MSDDTDRCGADTPNGPCKNPATEGNSCWIESHGGDRGASKFTEDRREEILEAAEYGATKKGCARAAGVTYRTLQNWLDRGQDAADEESDYFQFFQDFERARAEGELRLLRSDRTSPEFILERSYGYTKKEEIEHTGEDGGPLTIRREVVDVASEE